MEEEEEDELSCIPPTTLKVPTTYSSFDSTGAPFSVLTYIIGNTAEVFAGASGSETSLALLHAKNIMTIDMYK
jgi:hypothetical protein